MIVSKILILFLPLLLLAEANFGTGPFHRSPPASIPSGSSTSLNSQANQRIPSAPKLPHHNQHTPPSVHIEQVTLVPTQRSVSVEPATLPPKIDTDLRIEIQTPKPGLVQPPKPLHTNDANWDNNSYHVPKPILSRWSQPKFPSPSVNQPNSHLLVHVKPITHVTSKKTVTVDTATLPPINDTDSKIEIDTPVSEVIQKPDPFHTEKIKQDTSSYHVSKPASSPWSPPKFPTPSLNIHTVSQPNIVKSVRAEPVIVVTPEKSVNIQRPAQPDTQPSIHVAPLSPVTTEKTISVDPATFPPKIGTDSPIEIKTPIPPVYQKPHPFHRENINQDTSSYYISRPASSPWSPTKFPAPSLNKHTVSQPNIVESVHAEPVIVAILEKSVSEEPATLLPKIDTDAPIEIQIPKRGLVQPPNPFHTDYINQNTSPYHVLKPVVSPWSQPKFTNPSINIHKPPQPDTVESVHVEPVIVVTPEKLVSEESATLPPKIDTDAPIEIQIPKRGQVQPPNPFHRDYINQNTSPYHVLKPVVSPWSQPKFTNPSVNIHKPPQPDTVESVHVEPVIVVTPEKLVSEESATLPPKIDTDAPIEIQIPKRGQVQPPNPFHRDYIKQNTSPYHVLKPVVSPWSQPKFTSPSVNIHKPSQPDTVESVHVEPVIVAIPEKSVSEKPATLPPKIDTVAPIEIQIPKRGLVQPPNPFHTYYINQNTRPYHVPKPVVSPWSQSKFTSPSVNLHKPSQPDTVESVHAEPVIVAIPEKSVSEEPATLPPKIDTDAPIEIQIPKRGLVQPPNPFHTYYINQNTSPYHVPKPVVSPWSQPKFTSPSVNLHKPSQPDTVESVHVKPVIVVIPEKSISEEPATLSPKIDTDAPIEIQIPTRGLFQPPNPFHTDYINQNTSPYHVPRPAQSPWTPPKLRTPSVNIQTESQLKESVSMDPSNLPPKIYTDSHKEIQTPKPGLVQPPHNFHINNINWVNGPYHVPKPVSSPWTPPKFDTVPSNTLPFGHVSHASNVYPKPPMVSPVVSVDPASDLKKFSTDELLEIQTTETSLSNSIPRPVPSPRIPNKPSTNSSDKGNRKDIGPYHRSQRSADPWDQHTWKEDQISQNNPPPASGTEHPGSNLRRFMCPQANGYFKYKNQCSEYIECKNYKPQAYSCPIGLYFNSRAKWPEYPCDYPSNVQCGTETIPLPTTTSPPTTTLPLKVVTTPRPNFRCPQPHGYFKFNDKCEQYIECKNYVALIFSCPAGLHFNPRAEWTAYPCDHPSVVKCNSEPNDDKTQRPTEAPTTTSVQPTLSTRPPPPTTRSPPQSPTSRQPPRPPTSRRPPPPPPTITWRPRPPTTRQPPLPPPTTRSPPPPTSKSPPPPPPTISWRPRPPTTRPTPPATRQTPTPPPSTTRPPPPPSTTRPPPPPPPTTRPPTPPPTTSPLPVIIPGPKNEPDYNICPQQFGYFKFSDQCDKYIECKNYVPLLFTCPVGLHFNPLADWTEYPCEHPSKVHCNEEAADPKVPSTTQPPPAITTQIPVVTVPQPGSKLLGFKCPESNGYFEYNDQCSEYIECKNHVPLAYKCPSGLHFNVFAQWPEYPCGHPSKVQCHKEFGTKQPTGSPNVTSRPVAPPPPTIATPAPTIVTQSPTAVTPYLPRFPTQGTVRPSTERPPFEPIDHYCREPNGYYAVASQCDSYIECQGYRAMQRFCPAGLHFDSKAQWPKFPCNYASIVQCDKEPGQKQPTEHPNIKARPMRPNIATPRSTVATPYIPRFPTQGTVYPPTPSPSKPPVLLARPTIATPAPTIVTQSPTSVTPYIPRLPTQRTVRPSTERPKFELIDYYCQEPNGYYAVASQCDSYIECQGYRAMQRFCPAGLHFDSKAQWPKFPCNYPSIVQCDKEPGQKQPTEHPNIKARPMRPNIATPRSTVATPYIPRFPTQGTVYPPTPSPSKPPVLLARPTIATPAPTIVTQSPTSVTPYIPRLPTQRTVRPSTERPKFELIDYYCQEPNGYYAVASQCDSYIECQGYRAMQRFCPAGLHFDSKAQWPKFPCNYPSIVQCDKEPGQKQPTEHPNVKPRPMRPNIATPRSIVVTRSLPHFPTQGTVYPSTPSPSRPPVVPPRPTIATPVPTIVTQSPTAVTPYLPRFPTQGTVPPSTERPSFELIDYNCREPNGYYAVPSQCDSYIECKSNNAIQHFCPAGLHFNSKAQWPNFPCDYPPRVQYKNESVTDDPRPTIVTPRPAIATSRRPTGPVITRTPRQPPLKPSPSKQPFNFSCPETNRFYSVDSQCDAYVECKDGIVMEHTCPDGLLFNKNATWPDYPCGYPSEVTCSSGYIVQQPDPTAECPHREGFFPTDSGDCGEYKVCHAGVAIIKHCPPGLVFNFDKLNTCDWPINVPACNQARALEGFVCPSPPANENQLHVHKYRHGRSCTDFVACQKGHPRLLTCDAGLRFKEETESCVDSDLVMDCDA